MRLDRIVLPIILVVCVLHMILLTAVFHNLRQKSAALEQHCVRFSTPQTILCNVEATPLLSRDCDKICQYSLPERWVLTSTTGEVITVLGGDCFTAYHD